MIYFKKGNILDSKENYICHQVNCRGVMNAGLARQIHETWPQVYNDYMTKIQNDLMHRPLGEISATQIGDKQAIICMFAQDRYGKDARYTNYESFYLCLEKILNLTKPTSTIALPYEIGCGLGGANWNIIYEMIKLVLGNKREVYIYVLEDGD